MWIKLCSTIALLNAWIIFRADGQAFQLAQSDDCGTLTENEDARTKVPWTAGIFARANSKQSFKFLITGTVLSPDVILTVFAGAYGESARKGSKYFISPPANHIVAVGLKANNLQEVDRYTQIAEVSHIVPFGGHEPENRLFHIFLFHLKTKLKLDTPYVKAACLPVFLKTLPATGFGANSEARQGGFGSPTNADGSSSLQLVKVNIKTKEFCTEKFKSFYKGTSDHIGCATATSSNELACTLHGSSPVTPVYNNRWFVVGSIALIPSVKSEAHWCNKDVVYFYDRSKNTLDWLLANIKCAETNQYACGDGTCVSWEKVCNEKSDCSNGNADEDPIFCRAIKPCIYSGKTYECGVYGACVSPSQVCDGKADCKDGEDEISSVCILKYLSSTERPTFTSTAINLENNRISRPTASAVQKQKPITRPSRPSSACSPIQVAEQQGVSVRCTDPNNGDEIPCDQAEVNSVARLGCMPYYKSTYRLPTTEMKCQADGTWKPYRPFGCEPDCGILSSGLTAFIISGQTATRHDAFPWHAAIFLRKNDEHIFICGGSLVEKNIIITAAHCVSDVTGALVPKFNFKIVLGATSSNFKQNLETPNAQFFNVKNVWVPATYDRRSLQSDISLVQLDKSAVFGEYVRPVCYLSQTSSNAVPPPGQLGKVSGFGFVDDKKIAEKLQFAAFPVISPDECHQSLKRIPPLSTFCAGYKNGTSVCQGDSGGGMSFPEQVGSVTRYVLKGLVSHGEIKQGKLCDPENYAVFTHVDAYADWILQRLEGISRT